MSKPFAWLIYLLTSAFFACLITSCESASKPKQMTYNPRERPGHRNGDFFLMPPEMITLKRKAARGDGEAAWRIYLHYALAIGDKPDAEPWLRRAVQLGNPQAKHYVEIQSAQVAAR